MANQSAALRDLARQVRELDRRIAAKSTPQLAFSSIEDGAVQAYNRDGQQVLIIGKQWDGTYTSTVVTGPTPPTPSAAIITDGTEGLSVRWDGTFVDGAILPMDYLRVDIHISGVDGFTPDFANRYGTIIPPTGGEVAFHLTPGTYYVKLVCWSQAGVPSAASAQVTGLATAITVSSDGLAPTSSPDPEVFQGIQEMYARWTAITNADPVWYDVHVSTTLGFTPDSSTLVGSTRSSSMTIRALPGAAPPEGEEDPRKLQYGTVYYVRVVARDEDGSAAPSLQAVGQIFQATGVNIAADSVTTAHLLAGSITGEKFSAEVIVSGMFKTAEAGQRVEWGIAGIQGYKSDGNLMISFPTDPDQPALIDAEVLARKLTVTGGATFRSSSKIEADADVTLLQGIAPPVATPQMAKSYTSRTPDTSGLADADKTGLLGTFNLIPAEVSCIEWKEAFDTWVIHQIRPNGTRAWFFDYDGNPITWAGDYFADYENWEIWSVIEITTSTPAKNGVYRMARWIPSGSNNTYYLMCPQGGGFNRYSRQNGVTAPVVGTNGTDVYVAEVIGTQLNIRYFTPNGDGNNLSAPTVVYQSTKGFVANTSLSTVYYDAGAFDTGHAGAQYVVGYRGQPFNNRIIFTSGTNAGSIHPGGVAAGASSWDSANKEAQSFEPPVNNPRCVAWMDSDNAFWTYGGDGKLYQHGGVFWDPAVSPSMVWAQYTFGDTNAAGSGTHETTPGAFGTFTRPRRSKVIFYLPPIPGSGGVDEPNAVGVYAAMASSQPANAAMWRQAMISSSSGTTVQDVFATSGTNPPTVSTFPNTNPGKIQSEDGNMVISGAGTIRIGGKDVALGTPTVQVFASSGTWTKPSGAKLVHVKVVGGGGAGGGAPAPGGSGSTKGAGGGGGGTAEKWFLASDLASSIPVSIGGGGTASTSSGGAGGNSSFQHTTQVIGLGGAGGLSTTTSGTGWGAQPGAGGSASGGDLNYSGNAGSMGWSDTSLAGSGSGGSSSMGGGAPGRTQGSAGSAAAGVAGGNYGGGGSGAIASTTAAAQNGGAGAPGVVIVTCYF